MPVLVLLANTGIVMLYGDSITRWLDPDVRSVEVGSTETSLDAQLAAVQTRFPTGAVREIKTATTPTSPTVFLISGTEQDELVFVDPYDARVLGSRTTGTGAVQLATRLHAFLDVDAPIVSIPTVAALFDDGPGTIPISLSDAALEITAGWAIVLVASGVILWRRPRDRRARGVPSRRSFWRRAHATPGIVLAAGLMVSLLTGMLWSTYWGASWRRIAEAATPNQPFRAPDSAMSMMGMDGDHGSMSMAPITLNTVAATAAELGLDPGYSIVLPRDGAAPDGTATFGTFELRVDWPTRVSQNRSYYIDQFDGALLSVRTTDQLGALATVSEIGKQTHVGVQFGVVSRVLLTFVCLAVDWSAMSALAMWLRRRSRSGGLALPRRPVTASQVRQLRSAAVVMGVVFPLWGASALALWALDVAVIRRVRRPRHRPER